MPTPLTTSTLSETWPALPLEQWKPTYHNLHMWTQIVGKVRLALTPKTNHWWNVPLYVTARGLTTSPIPYGKRFVSTSSITSSSSIAAMGYRRP